MSTFIGSGAAGDSIIIGTKLLNIIKSMKLCHVTYEHYETNKHTSYNKLLNDIWTFIKESAEQLGCEFNYTIEFYPNGKFYSIVPQKVFNNATALTTKVDELCIKIPEFKRDWTFGNSGITIVTDGGNGTRTISQEGIRQIKSAFPERKITLLGAKTLDIEQTDGIINISGKTKVIDALHIIDWADIVIGPDGLLTYYAYMANVPSLILFHEANLIEQYWNKNLLRKSKPILSSSLINDLSRLIPTM